MLSLAESILDRARHCADSELVGEAEELRDLLHGYKDALRDGESGAAPA
jgi:hypothetical protein